MPLEQRFASKRVLHPIRLLLVLDRGRRPRLRHETELVVLDRELVLERLKFGGSQRRLLDLHISLFDIILAFFQLLQELLIDITEALLQIFVCLCDLLRFAL